MRKLSYFLIGLLIAVTLAPFAFARSNYPVYIKDVDVYTRPANQGISAEMTVCSSVYGRTSFDLKVVNETVNAFYQREFLSVTNGCHTYDVYFNDDFDMVSNAGDKLEFSLRNIYQKSTLEEFERPAPYRVAVEDRDVAEAPCGDSAGDDDVYFACVGDFITHTPTGVRMKLVSFDRDKADLVTTGIQWGGLEKVRIYEERDKEIIAADERLTRLNITNLGRGESGTLSIMIESY